MDTSIIATLELSRRAGATDQRDRVYGLLGLPSFASFVSITPNYHMETPEVFTNFTEALLKQTDLAALRLVYRPVEEVEVKWKHAVPRRESTFGLWVPRLVSRRYSVASPYPHKLPSWVICCACSPAPSVFLPGHYHADRGLHVTPHQVTMLSQGHGKKVPILRVQAVLIDKIATLAASNFSEADRTYPYNCDDAPTIPNAYGSFDGLREALWRCLVANTTSNGGATAPDSWVCLLESKFWSYSSPYSDIGPGVKFGLSHCKTRHAIDVSSLGAILLAS